jgi:hypothetical protein
MMERSLIILFILLALLKPAISLSVAEKEGLNSLLVKFPSLSSLPSPWTSNTSEACGNNTHISWTGIKCSIEDHVVELYVN